MSPAYTTIFTPVLPVSRSVNSLSVCVSEIAETVDSCLESMSDCNHRAARSVGLPVWKIPIVCMDYCATWSIYLSGSVSVCLDCELSYESNIRYCCHVDFQVIVYLLAPPGLFIAWIVNFTLCRINLWQPPISQRSHRTMLQC